MAATVVALSGKIRSRPLNGWSAAMAMPRYAQRRVIGSKQTPVSAGSLCAQVMSPRWRRIGDPASERFARRRRIELVALRQGRPGGKIAAGGLKPLHQIAGLGVEDPVARLDQGATDGAQDVRLAGAAVAGGNRVGRRRPASRLPPGPPPGHAVRSTMP